MKNLTFRIMVLAGFLSLFGFKSSTDPTTWTNVQVDTWFEKGEWLNGWKIKPDGSINRREFAISYFKNKERWDKAFTFLKTSDLSKLEIKRHDIDGDNLYATVSEYTTKNEADAKFEAHQKYIDIQYVISGTEQMSVAPLNLLKEVVTPYDSAKDVGFMTVAKSKSYTATQANFFIFFPSDIHRPSVKVSENSPLRKIVVKVKVN
jgi:biofilm protein TabA